MDAVDDRSVSAPAFADWAARSGHAARRKGEDRVFKDGTGADVACRYGVAIKMARGGDDSMLRRRLSEGRDDGVPGSVSASGLCELLLLESDRRLVMAAAGRAS